MNRRGRSISTMQDIRRKVWLRWCGDSIYGMCYICNEKLDVFNWDCGKIRNIEESNDEEDITEHYRPRHRRCSLYRGCYNMSNVNIGEMIRSAREKVNETTKTKKKRKLDKDVDDIIDSLETIALN
jgi:hypothetical protein